MDLRSFGLGPGVDGDVGVWGRVVGVELKSDEKDQVWDARAQYRIKSLENQAMRLRSRLVDWRDRTLTAEKKVAEYEAVQQAASAQVGCCRAAVDSEGFAHDHAEWYSEIQDLKDQLANREATVKLLGQVGDGLVRRLLESLDEKDKRLQEAHKQTQEIRAIVERLVASLGPRDTSPKRKEKKGS